MVLELGGKSIWRDTAEAAVRSDFVVFLPPGFDETASFGQGGEPVLIEAFVAELAIEAFDEGVLRGFAWGGEV